MDNGRDVESSAEPDNIYVFSWEHLDSDQFLSENLGYLSDAEVSRLNRSRNPELKKRFAFSRIILRHQLGQALGCEPSRINISRDSLDKPFLADVTGMFFSVSHSQRLITITISRQHLVGVDVEYIHRKNRIEDIARQYFSSEEYDYLLQKDMARSEFFRLWTLKEAYVKAEGTGLTKALNSFRFEFNPATVFHNDKEAGETTFFSFQLSDDFILSFCAFRNNAWAPKFFSMDETMHCHLYKPQPIVG